MKLKIGFVGSPFSGKTTTAAHVFAELKRLGHPVEFLPEHAREHIRNRRKEAHIQGTKEVPMGDDDQMRICRGQYDAEHDIMNFSGDSVILISDGSTVNASFYTERELFDAEKLLSQYDILFFSRNVERAGDGVDGNRVHDADFSKLVDAHMKQFFSIRVPANVVELSGGVDDRVAKALSAIAEMIQMLEDTVQ
jgi:AAA domain-containing protein